MFELPEEGIPQPDRVTLTTAELLGIFAQPSTDPVTVTFHRATIHSGEYDFQHDRHLALASMESGGSILLENILQDGGHQDWTWQFLTSSLESFRARFEPGTRIDIEELPNWENE